MRSNDKMMTSKQLADRLGLKRHQLDYLIDSGVLPPPKTLIAGRRLFASEEVRQAERIVREKLEQASVPDIIVEVQHD